MGAVRAIGHLNIVGFRAAVAELQDKTLRGRPFVITGGSAGRSLVWDVSPAALAAEIRPGMPLAAARRITGDLTIIEPDPSAYRKVNEVLEKIAAYYAPAWQNDGAGNIYLDITGTRCIWGAPPDCICRVFNEMKEETGLEAAASAAVNKLVCKVASRTIRPAGLVEIRSGDEAAFFRHQDITLLPGMGKRLLHTAAVTGFREIGEVAALSDGEALALFGKQGVLLRDRAKGIDAAPVAGNTGKRKIVKQADFSEDVIDENIIRGTMVSLAEYTGLEMRRDKLGAGLITLTLVYSDGGELEGGEKGKRLLILDREIAEAAGRVYRKTAVRRIRIRSLRLCLEDFTPLGYEADLFEPETDTKEKGIQEAVDKIQIRYGAGTIMKGVVLEAMRGPNPQKKDPRRGKRLLTQAPGFAVI